MLELLERDAGQVRGPPSHCTRRAAAHTAQTLAGVHGLHLRNIIVYRVPDRHDALVPQEDLHPLHRVVKAVILTVRVVGRAPNLSSSFDLAAQDVLRSEGGLPLVVAVSVASLASLIHLLLEGRQPSLLVSWVFGYLLAPAGDVLLTGQLVRLINCLGQNITGLLKC